MNNAVSVNKQATGKSYYLSELLGARVVRAGKKVGRLSDLVIIDGNLVAEVSHLYVTRPFGEPALLVPWDKVRLMSNKEIVIDIESPEKYAVVNGHKLLLLKDDVVNKKVLDTEGKEVDVVYDVKLVIIDNRLYVSEVDMSRYGLLRSLGLRWLADLIYNLANKIKHETVPWAYVQPLPSDIGSFSGDLRLRVLKEKLSEMHPVDLADILTEMDPEQRLAVFDQLRTSKASDTLEQIDPAVQRAILASLTPGRISELLNEMTPGQAADILAILPSQDINAILQRLSPGNAEKIRDILGKHEEKILNYATHSYLRFPPDMTVAEAHEEYRRSAKMSDVIMYLYVVDKEGKLLGIIDIRELMRAPDNAHLKDIMVTVVASLSPESTLREASAKFQRYGFRALPVLDDSGGMLGAVSFRDMTNLRHRFLE